MSDLHDQWPHRWVNAKTQAYNSPIQGLGIKAIRKISKGETVAVLGGVIVPISQIDEYRKDMGQVGIQINEAFFIVPSSREELGLTGVFNHSCAPNIGFSSSIVLVAMHDINVGEELVFDYAFCEICFPGFTCRCGAPDCRGNITQDDWQIAEIKRKYGAYFSPYLQNKL